MSEWRLWKGDAAPDVHSPEFYSEREAVPHLEQQGHRQRLLLAAEFVEEAVRLGGDSVVDLGAGDGGLLQAVRERKVTVPMWGFDLAPSNVAAARSRGVEVALIDFVNDEVLWADVVCCCEVLEHLVDPHAMVRRIAESGARYLIASSPYTETDQAHYELHLWAWDHAGYREMIEANGWKVISSDTAWICQVVLAERAP